MLTTVGYGDVTPVSLSGVVLVCFYLPICNYVYECDFEYFPSTYAYPKTALFAGHPSDTHGRTDLLLRRCQAGRSLNALDYQPV